MNFSTWYASHKQVALGGGGAVAVVVLALYDKRKKHKAVTATTTAGTPASAVLSSPDGLATAAGTVGLPGTSLTDVQNAVQDQINQNLSGFRTEFGQEITTRIAGIPVATGLGAGAPGSPSAPPIAAPPAAGKPPAVITRAPVVVKAPPRVTAPAAPPELAEYAVNTNRLAHKLDPYTDAQYQTRYGGNGTLENAAQRRYITSKAAQPGAVMAPRPAPRPAPKVAPKASKFPVRPK